MGNGGIQQKLGRVRPPRVHITYEVETEGAIVLRDLPFVLGVMGGYSGMLKDGHELPPLAKREFLEIDRDNFSDIMQGMEPHLAFKVKNALDENSKDLLSLSLDFKNIEDFSPEQVAEQIPALKELVDIRKRLSNLLSKTDGNEALSKEIAAIANDQARMKEIQDEVNAKKSATPKEQETGAESTTTGGDA